tara:strand:+ start:898 stop:2085 length:1188 start_codon:yes stop_codon:yes gene_type:complete
MGIVTDSGNLFMCGYGQNQRGLGQTDHQITPTLVARAVFDGEAVLMVACGGEHTVAVTEGGGVYTFGRGSDGQLGHGDKEDQLKPMRVPVEAFRPNESAQEHSNRIVMVAAGSWHTVALSEAGHVFTWGCGSKGQLGHNNDMDELVPRQIGSGAFMGEKVVFVAAGRDHTVAVTSEGHLYTWGNGSLAELGHGDTGNRLVPTLVGGFGAPEGGRVVMAACGSGHTLVVTQDGALWACGFGRYGQLGLNDRPNFRHAFERVEAGAFGGARVVAAAAGDTHSAAVTEDGALWTWGLGNYGQLGHGDEGGRLVPTKVSGAGLRGGWIGRIGRCQVPRVEHVLAFAMSTHRRVGQDAASKNMLPELIEMIFGNRHRVCGLDKDQYRAVLTLIGCISMYN